jgi:hypothetical protein
MGKVTRKGLKVLGVGLSRTGTTSLTKALEVLGYKTVHGHADSLLDILLGAVSEFDYHCFDDIDAVTDVPTAHFYNEILAAYPDCKAILTVRDADSWFDSYVNYDRAQRKNGWLTTHQIIQHALGKNEVLPITIRRVIYGSYAMKEILYKKSFIDHNRRVQYEIANDRLLIMDILGGDGWPVLCGFLGRPIPDEPFPFLHTAESVSAGNVSRPATYRRTT